MEPSIYETHSCIYIEWVRETIEYLCQIKNTCRLILSSTSRLLQSSIYLRTRTKTFLTLEKTHKIVFSSLTKRIFKELGFSRLFLCND